MSQLTRLQQHLTFVYQHSPFYREAWNQAWSQAQGVPNLSDLPIVNHSAFWLANRFEVNQVMTAPFDNGLVFKSGGTTGNPKFSYFSNEDWRLFCQVFGRDALIRGGLQAGERIANLFYGGQLYASFLFIGRSIEEAGVGVNFPISGSAPADEVLKTLKQFQITTLAGVPTTIMNLLPALAEDPALCSQITRFIYGGEPMYPDQIEALQKVLPHCSVRSIGIAGVDYGEMGFVDDRCDWGVHRVLDASTVVELIDEQGQPIEQVGQAGRIVITNLNRKLMPIVRYPVGDQAMWVDEPGLQGRRYKLLGRTEEGARIGPVTLYVEDVQGVLKQAGLVVDIISFQLVVTHQQQKDGGVLRLAVAKPQSLDDAATERVIQGIYQQRKLYAEAVAQGLIHPLRIEWVLPDQLHTNPRTGKLMRVVDQRQQAVS